MAFPEIRRKIGEFFSERSQPIALNLKSNGEGSNIGGDAQTFAKYLRLNPQIAEALGMQNSWSGESVTTQSALMNSIVWACNQIVAGTIGALPATLKQRRRGDIRDADEHPMAGIV